MMRKKAMEQPRVIIYVLFTTILALAGIFVGFNYLGFINYTWDLSDFNLRYTLDAARMINSAECFAYQPSYQSPEPENKKYYVVQPGIIDWNRLSGFEGRIPEGCIRRESAYVKIDALDGSLNAKLYAGEGSGEPNIDWASKKPEAGLETKQYVLIRDRDGRLRPGKLEFHLKK